MDTSLLKMEKISKSFPGVKALDEVDLEVHEGEVLALVGENGAGKTTLMEILNPHPAPTGFYRQDSGRIFLRGEEIHPRNPSEAQALGISFIHQHFNLAPNLTVAENIFLGREPRRFKALRIVDREEISNFENSLKDSTNFGKVRLSEIEREGEGENIYSFVLLAELISGEGRPSLTQNEITESTP